MKNLLRNLYVITVVLMLAGCGQNAEYQEETALINDYMYNIRNVLKAHVIGINNAKDIAAYDQQQSDSLQNLATIKQAFSEHAAQKELQAVISTVDFALSRLYLRNQQIFALSAPMWQSGDEKFNAFKDPDYYSYHQTSLMELNEMMLEFADLLRDHTTDVRERMLASGLSEERRRILWPSLSRFMSEHIASFTPQIKVIKRAVEDHTQIAAFLNEHQAYYEFTEQEGLLFSDPVVLSKYNNMLARMARRQ